MFEQLIYKSLEYCLKSGKREAADGLSILIYHRILETKDFLRPSEPTLEEFEWQMALLANYFTPLSLSEAFLGLQNKNLPRNAICVTFDDGYADNLELAAPVLKRWKIPATVFISSGFLNGGIMWNDLIIEFLHSCEQPELDLSHLDLGTFTISSRALKVSTCNQLLSKVKYLDFDERKRVVEELASLGWSLPKNLMMTEKQVLSLSRYGMDIGAHTLNHPILSNISDEKAKDEIIGSKNHLEKLAGKKIDFFAYPNGRYNIDFNEKHARFAQEAGFIGALTTDQGVSSYSTNPYMLRRFTPWDKTPLKFFTRLHLNRTEKRII